MDRLDSMSLLVAITEAGSLSAAGRRLGLSLTTVSRKIADLESHLKARLLHRSSRRMELTDAGRTYIAACKRILEDVDAAERAVAGEFTAPKGDLVIAAPVTFGRLHVVPIVTEFLTAYPEINIRMTLADRVVDLVEEHIDVALRIGALPDSSMIATRVGEIRRVVCGSPAYLAKRGTPKRPGDLTTHDCVTFEGMTSADAWIFGSGTSTESVAVKSRLAINTADAAIAAAVGGIGLTRVLSYQVAHAIANKSLTVMLQDFEPPPMPVSLVYTTGRMLPVKVRAFLDFATPRLKAALADELS